MNVGHETNVQHYMRVTFFLPIFVLGITVFYECSIMSIVYGNYML